MKAPDHVHITQEAIRRFAFCAERPIASMLLENSHLIQQGAADADIRPLFSRITNWHFYNRNLDIECMYRPKPSGTDHRAFHFSSEHILCKRYEQFTKAAAQGSLLNVYNLMGRILHHIQDMSSPSHVVPIYHGPLVSDSFENYLHRTFFASKELLRKRFLADLGCNDTLIPSPNNTILHIYHGAAEETLGLLQPEISCCQGKVNGEWKEIPWNMFWTEKVISHRDTSVNDSSFAGFGRFGTLGKYFGKTDPIVVRGETFEIEQDIYDGFCCQLIEKMLKDSIKTLFLLEMALQKQC